MPKRLLILLLYCSPYLIYGQSQLLELTQLDTPIVMEHHLDYFVDESRSMSFEEIQKKTFSQWDVNSFQDIQAISWFKIRFSPIIKTKYLIISLEYVDDSEIYVPYKNSYKKFRVGMNEVLNIQYDIYESGMVYLETKNIDFSKPFFFNKIYVSINSKLLMNNPGVIIISNYPKLWVNQMLISESNTAKYKVYISIILISCVLFFISFLVLKDQNFLNYSLYLFFTALLFFPKIPFGYNFLRVIHPYLGYLISQVSVVITSALYFRFVVEFIAIKSKFPKIYPLTKWTVKGSIIFAFILLFLLSFIPYFPYRFELITLYKIFFLIISVFIFVVLFLKRLPITERIVVIGSLFLIAGHLASIITGNIFHFLTTVLVEIVIFSTVVSFQNKIKHQQQIASIVALNNEKKERENLAALNQMKSKFFANISHEFRTPLTLILGPIQKILKDENLDFTSKENLGMVKRNANRLLELVDQILDISKIETGNLSLKISKRPIIPFTTTLVQSFEFLAKQKSIHFEMNIDKTETTTWFDKDAVEKIILNLLSNTIKYTPEHGKIITSAKVQNDFFHFKVRNTGKGLSKEETQKVFDRFYQKDEHKEGAGIGLSLVKELITIYKGEINVDSTSEWTRFSVILPINKSAFRSNQIIDDVDTVHRQKSTITEEKIQNQNNENQNNENPILLIVEDNDDLRTYIQSIFEKDYTILQAKNGKIGIEKAIQHIPDIIISDIMMPIKDGIELSKTLKSDQRTSHIPIILLTAKVGEDHVIDGLKTGADDYITKPFNEDLLKLKIDNLFAIREKLQKRYSQEIVLKPKDVQINTLENQFLESLQDIIDHKIADPNFTIDSFSKSVAMSRMQLHRKLKAVFGMTTSEFIRVQRMKIAVQLLEKSDISISEIAYQVGYVDLAYFSKCFKQTYGCSPSEYATRLKE